MYRAFEFEGEIHARLDCVPLTVRRKLDLAQRKISLQGWQALTRAERLALCHLPVDAPGDLAIYVEVLEGFAGRAGVTLKLLEDPHAAARTWNAPVVPERVAARLSALGVRLDDEAWRALDEESRYALLKLADPQRDSNRLHAACVELGLLAGPAPVIAPSSAICVAKDEG